MVSYSEAAIERRRERGEFVERFPGRLSAWSDAVGKRVAAAEALPGARVIVVFDDGTHLLAGPASTSTDDAQAALLAARAALEPFHPAAYAELDEKIAAEREAMRLARMEKVIGAVQTNLPNIPELRDELRRLLGEEP